MIGYIKEANKRENLPKNFCEKDPVVDEFLVRRQYEQLQRDLAADESYLEESA